MKVNATLTEIRKECEKKNSHITLLIRKEEEERNAARKAHLAEGYTRSEHAKPFSWDA